MRGRSISAAIFVVVVTVLIPSTWAETGSGSLSQKIRRESRESDKYWPNEVGITDQQLRQFLADSLTNSYSTGAGQPRDVKQGYPYGSRDRIGEPALEVDGSEEPGVAEREATPRGSSLGTSKRNGFFYGKRNGFFHGKRSASNPANANECTPCGPQNSGQCVMFGTCCSYASGGCYFLTDEALPCVTSKSSSICELKGTPCGTDGHGRCVADSVCCAPQEGACYIDSTCIGDTYQ